MTLFRDDFSAQAFLVCVVAGACTAVLHDLFCGIRRFPFTGKKTNFMLDVLFCFFAVVIAFLVALPVSFGRLRIYQVAGEAVGASVYFLTVGSIFRRIRRFANRKKKITGTAENRSWNKQVNLGKRSQKL